MDQAADSISEWFGGVKVGDADAAQMLWNHYSAALLRVAKRRLGESPCGIGDEEDIALSVFGSIFRGAAAGRFDQISSRDELWWLLLANTKRKVVDHIRREVAQKRCTYRNQHEFRHENGESNLQLFSLDELIDSSPTPDFLVELEDQYARMLDMLRNDQLRKVAILRVEGYTVVEIAQQINIGHRAVERKLQLIRDKWKRDLLEPERAQ